ncbi:MAG: GTPase ObgE [SAR324 cluster bacterium]|nr:GTPase ObgE [SAR324 cluster bacterium]
MKFVDYVKINIRSGTGGNGCTAFRRERFIPRGGPNGGDGGRGGDVRFQGTPNKSTLLDFRYQRHYAGERGEHGRGQDRHGRNGRPLTISVPLGTLVKDAETGEVLLELLDETPRLLLRGAAGGRGNARFKTSTNRVPMECEPGAPGEEHWVELELKLIADVGLVGFPNAGKSTLISRVSRARPKIADYPFTTLVPNLGVVQTEGFESFVVADIPGIIRGAHEGAGLGHRFLRHIERTALLLLLLDLSELAEQDPEAQYEALLEEMRLYSAALPEKPRAVALTKADLVTGEEAVAGLRQRLEAAGERVFLISAVTGAGLPGLLNYLAREVAAAHGQRNSAGRVSGSSPDRKSPRPGPASSGTSTGSPW